MKCRLHLLLLSSVLLLVLSACDSGRVKTGSEAADSEDRAGTTDSTETVSQASVIADALGQARKYLAMAESSDDPDEQQAYRLKAARYYIKANKPMIARDLLERVQAGLDQKDLDQKSQNQKSQDLQSADQTSQAELYILYSLLALRERDGASAEQYISLIKPVTREQQIEFYEIKAELDFLSERYLYSIDRRSQLEAYFTDARKKAGNHKRIWAALSNMPDDDLVSTSSTRPDVAGWLALARAARNNSRNMASLENALLDWGMKHPQHPANDGFLAELIAIYQQDAGQGRRIAIILPLRGDLATVSSAIKNGFLAAYYTEKSGPAPELAFYDSSKAAAFEEIYQQAVADGATHIIGPLDKQRVAELLAMQALEVPVISLNYVQTAEPHYVENLFQFGLSPEDEARQVAELAMQQGQTRAAVFYPDSDWGRRVKNAFNVHYRSLGGAVHSEADYVTNTNDYRQPVRRLLNLDKSQLRRQRIENIIGERTESEPRRRQDIDFIFLAATSRSARSIMPSFKFHHAGDLPVYSTSHVYTGTPDRDNDRDLDGLVFCDLPWILQDDSALKTSFKQNWPQQQPYTRLFALGVDAYRLVYNLGYMQSFTDVSFPGKTGEISLDEYNRMNRRLPWARFVKGRPLNFVPVPVIPEPETGVDTSSRYTGQARNVQAANLQMY